MKTLAVTRPVGQGGETAKFILELGWNPFILHTIELHPSDRSTILTQLRNAISIGPVDWMVFMSAKGVELLFDILRAHNILVANILGECRIVSVGPRTRDALAKQGVMQTLMPDNYSSDGVCQLLSRYPLENARVILFRSSDASDALSKTLKASGASPETIHLYKSSPPSDRDSLHFFLEGLGNNQFQAVLFTSALSVTNLFKMTEENMSAQTLTGLLKNCCIGAIGPATQKQLQTHGLDPIVPTRYLINEAVNELIEHARKFSVVSQQLTNASGS